MEDMIIGIFCGGKKARVTYSRTNREEIQLADKSDVLEKVEEEELDGKVGKNTICNGRKMSQILNNDLDLNTLKDSSRPEGNSSRCGSIDRLARSSCRSRHPWPAGRTFAGCHTARKPYPAPRPGNFPCQNCSTSNKRPRHDARFPYRRCRGRPRHRSWQSRHTHVDRSGQETRSHNYLMDAHGVVVVPGPPVFSRSACHRSTSGNEPHN